MTDSPETAGSSASVALTFDLGATGLAQMRIHPRQGNSIALRLDDLLEIEMLLAGVEARIADGSLRLLVIRTEPPHLSLTGYDIEEIRRLRDQAIVAWSQGGQRILRRLELLEVPSIAAIQSEWIGGAAELALACSYRVASGGPGPRLGFPQVHRGFIPAWGGTVRLPRLIGLQEALRLVVSGPLLNAQEAHEIGLVDRILPAEEFDGHLERYALRRLDRGRVRRRRRRPVRRRLLDETAPGRRLLAARAYRLFLDPAASNLAGRLAIDVLVDTATQPLERAFTRESAATGELIASTEVQGRFHSERFTERAARRSPLGPAEFEALAVLGAGETAGDMAHLLVSMGAPVRIKSSREGLQTALARARGWIHRDEQQGRVSEQHAQRRTARLEAATGFGGFGLLDLVIATPDGSGRSAEEMLLEIEPHVRDECLLGFHDWSASPSDVQRALKNPERVVALLPGFPTDRFCLLEIVPGSLTSPEATSAARRLSRRLSLTGVVVPDDTPSPGTRLIGVYLTEATRLLDEGATVAQVDDTMTAFGFELGPFQRIDTIGTRRSLRLLRSLAYRLGDRMRPTPLFTTLAEGGGTFYRYRGGRPAGLNPELPAGLSPGGDALTRMIHKRMLLLLLNEAARIVEEGGIGDPGDLEVIAILGLGFPREHGGLLFHAEELGTATIVDELDRMAARFGDRYSPARLLRDLATNGRGFFGGNVHPASGHESAPALQ